MSEASSKQVAARLGFCCKYIPPDGDAVLAKGANLATVTMTALSRLAPAAAFDRLSAVVRHNLQALRLQIEHVATRPPIERLHRLQSQMLPGYTHPVCAPLYRDGDLRKEIERGLDTVGSAARRAGIRLGMHPDQFCVLATASTPARKNALAELEYHAEIMRMLGYGSGWHPGGAHINIHGGARQAGIEGFRAGFAQLSDTARNLVTVENEEVSFGLDDLLPLADTLPIVLDLHHHWIASRGEYITPHDTRLGRIVESWRDVRPVSHVSVSREILLPDHDPRRRPDYEALVAAGLKPRDLRGHSDLMWNEAVNDLVADHLAWSDFEIEAKLKNLASEQVARHVERRRMLRAAE